MTHHIPYPTEHRLIPVWTLSLQIIQGALKAVDANCQYNQPGSWSAKPLVEEALKEIEYLLVRDKPKLKDKNEHAQLD